MVFDRRLRAYSIDSSFAFVLMAVVIIILYDIKNMDNFAKWLIVLTGYMAIMTVPYLFSPGQTFGKRIQKLRVVNKTEELAVKEYTVPRVYILILREILKAVFTFATFGFYIFLAGIIATNREDGRTIHDFIFGTRVIVLTRYTDEKTEMNKVISIQKRLKGSGYND